MPDLFQTQEIELRAFEPEDIPALHAYLNHPDLAGRRYLPWGFPGDAPLSRRQVEGILSQWGEEKKALNLAVVLRASGALVGHALMEWDWDPHCPSVSVVIDPAHQRQGYGSQALQLALRYLFEQMPAHNITAWVAGWNEAGQRFASRQGFQESGRSRREGMRAGAAYDEVVMDILRPEWQEQGKIPSNGKTGG